jgi:predicted regulator of Ras-like GTPase activity (Roadblock/LC7/MglB family)
MADEIRRLSDDLARDPSSLVFMPLADALRRAGQLDVALRVALRGLDRHPYVADAHDVLARIHADRGDLERAADEWEMALRLDPSHPQARLGLGFIDFRRGNLESAEERLSQASGNGEQDPSVAAALVHVRTALTARMGAAQPAIAEPTIDFKGSESLKRKELEQQPFTGFNDSDPLKSEHPRSVATAAAPAALFAPSPVPEYPQPKPSHARQLFSAVLEGADQTALLVDADGLVLAGSYTDANAQDVSEIVAAELAGVSGEAERAMRHLGLGAWTSMLVEADNSIVAMTPAPLGSLLVVAAGRQTPVGLVRLLLDRALTRARDWLARVS